MAKGKWKREMERKPCAFNLASVLSKKIPGVTQAQINKASVASS